MGRKVSRPLPVRGVKLSSCWSLELLVRERAVLCDDALDPGRLGEADFPSRADRIFCVAVNVVLCEAMVAAAVALSTLPAVTPPPEGGLR